MNYLEWGVQSPDGVTHPIDPAAANEAYMTPEELARVYEAAGRGTVVTRIRTSHVTPWTTGDTSWVTGCLDVLQAVLEERVRQVARYGLNDECEDGTGSGVRWLAYTDINLDLRTAKEIEAAFRAEYEKYEKRHGLPTWMHLIREEMAEAFAEDDLEKRNAEATQVAALLVSWIEATVRRGR